MQDSPPSDMQGSPPTGAVSATSLCCPTVSTFDGSRTASRVAGFDARTNLAQNRGSDEYWIPPDAAKSAPGDRYTQDGAAWVSVGLERSVDVEISFEGDTSNACIGNSSFELVPEGIVSVTPNRVAASGATLTLTGLAAGETTVKVTCEGDDLGWFHVVCYPVIPLRVSVGCIRTPLSRVAAYSSGALQAILTQVYKAAQIDIRLVDLGVLDLSANATVTGQEPGWRGTVPGPYYSEGFGELQGQSAFLGNPAGPELAGLGAMAVAARAQSGGAGGARIRLWYYVPDDVPSRFNGLALDIPSRDGFVFKDYAGAPDGYGITDSYGVLAHELGHNLGLFHPDDGRIGAQLPGHLVGSLGAPVAAEPATNTEPAIVPTPRALLPKNVVKIMQRDPLNLMGYWPQFTEQLFLRRAQWDVVRAAASATAQ